VITWQIWAHGFWVRVCGIGVGVRRAKHNPPLFSERNGHARIFRIGGWIVKPLGRPR